MSIAGIIDCKTLPEHRGKDFLCNWFQGAYELLKRFLPSFVLNRFGLGLIRSYIHFCYDDQGIPQKRSCGSLIYFFVYLERKITIVMLEVT